MSETDQANVDEDPVQLLEDARLGLLMFYRLNQDSTDQLFPGFQEHMDRILPADGSFDSKYIIAQRDRLHEIITGSSEIVEERALAYVPARKVELKIAYLTHKSEIGDRLSPDGLNDLMNALDELSGKDALAMAVKIEQMLLKLAQQISLESG